MIRKLLPGWRQSIQSPSATASSQRHLGRPSVVASVDPKPLSHCESSLRSVAACIPSGVSRSKDPQPLRECSAFQHRQVASARQSIQRPSATASDTETGETIQYARRQSIQRPSATARRRYCKSAIGVHNASVDPKTLSHCETMTDAQIVASLARQSIQRPSATARAGCSEPCHKGICDMVCEHLPLNGRLARSQQQPR